MFRKGMRRYKEQTIGRASGGEGRGGGLSYVSNSSSKFVLNNHLTINEALAKAHHYIRDWICLNLLRISEKRGLDSGSMFQQSFMI